MKYLRNSVVLVTGASSGIGAACAEAFAAAGARVVLASRRGRVLRRLVAQLQMRHRAEAHALEMDVRDADAVAAAIDGLPPGWRDIDVLVNNAGLARGLKGVHENTAEEVDEMLDTNVRGVLNVVRAVVPGMLERQRGHVINVGSVAGRDVYPGGTVYCATKHAVVAITRGLKMDLHGTPVRVSTVDPGLVETNFSVVRFSGDTERASSVYDDTTPLAPADVADAVLFCASRAPHVNISELVLVPTVQSSVTMIQRARPA
jgi:3-hydroxy acid dehydrogenase / malonic semialdehyde reductase